MIQNFFAHSNHCLGWEVHFTYSQVFTLTSGTFKLLMIIKHQIFVWYIGLHNVSIQLIIAFPCVDLRVDLLDNALPNKDKGLISTGGSIGILRCWMYNMHMQSLVCSISRDAHTYIEQKVKCVILGMKNIEPVHAKCRLVRSAAES